MAIAENIRGRGRDWLLLAGIAILVAGAAMLGRSYDREIRREMIRLAIPDSTNWLIQHNSHKWEIRKTGDSLAGYIYLGEGKGYNGPVSIAVRTDTLGHIAGVIPLQQRETPSYFQKLESQGFFDAFQEKVPEHLPHKHAPDLISGATISSRAVHQAAMEAYARGERLPLPANKFRPGMLEFSIVFLLFLGLALKNQRISGWSKPLLWISWLASMLTLGFLYNAPITLSRIASFSSGYLPDIFSDLAVYLLVGGGIGLFLVSGKNTYCHSVCPFGAAQEILARTGNAKPWRPSWFRKWKWVQWGGALAALLAALSWNDPSLAQYEVFGVFFKLTGSPLLFAATIIVVVVSLFVKRPWCRFFCPIDGVFAYMRLLRQSVAGLFK